MEDAQRPRRVADARGIAVASATDVSLSHPAWRSFMQYCHKLQHGEIERLKIQDGLPVLAEITRKKVKFTD